MACRSRGSQHWLGSPNEPTGGEEPATASATRRRGHGRRREWTRSRQSPRSTQRIGPPGGYRKIAAMLRADGHQVSTATVQRALRRRGLLLPTGFRADRRSWARLRKRAFPDPPRQRNRVWQMDFSDFETARGGIWRICAVIDDATKYASPPPSPRRLAARMRSAASAGPLSRPNGSSTSTTSVPTAA